MEDLPGIILLSLRIALAVLLYVFLAGALRLVWLDLKAARKVPDKLGFAPAILAVSTPDQTRYRHILTQPVNVIGRSSNSEVVISDSTVSASHARVFLEEGQWWIEDLASSNGTFIEDLPVLKPTVLITGDTIRIGEATVTVVLDHNQNTLE